MERNVLVTGSAGGIGSAIVTRLSGRGYPIYGLDREKPLRDVAYRSFSEVDLRSRDAIETYCKCVQRRNITFWGLVLCAGVFPIRNLEEYDVELWDEVLQINLNSAFLIVRRLHRLLQKNGRVVVIASGAVHGGSRDIGYSVSKGGLVGLMRGLTKILTPQKVLINAVCPGLIETDMSRRMSKRVVASLIRNIPLGRPGKPDEVAVCVEFLLDKGNSYMSGEILNVDGGLFVDTGV